MMTKFSTLAVYAALLGSALTSPSFAMEIEREDHKSHISGLYNIQRYDEESSGRIKIEQKGANSFILSAFELFEDSTYSKTVKEQFENSEDLLEKRIGSFIRTDMPAKIYELNFLGDKFNPQYGICVDYAEGKMQIRLSIEEDKMRGYTYELYVTEPTTYMYTFGSGISTGAPNMRFILQKEHPKRSMGNSIKRDM